MAVSSDHQQTVEVSELLLGIDIGTSSSKGVLARPDGTIVASAERPHGLSLPRPGWAEHDAESVWWADFVAICTELLSLVDSRGADQGADGQTADRIVGQSAARRIMGRGADERGTVDRIAAVCVSGIGPCLLPTDAAGQPLRPAILYGIDTRAGREIDEVNARLRAETILQRCGSPLTSQAIGPKILWLRRHLPAVWERTRHLHMAHSFITQRLTGEYALDHHAASQCTPLYDLADNRWIEEWAEDIAPGVPLPRLVWPAQVVGTVTPGAARVTGLAAGTPVVAGTIDAWAEAVSVGVRDPGDLMIMYGTTMFLVQVVEEVRPHPSLWSTAGVFAGTRSLAAGMATSGALTAWFRDITGEPSFESLVEEAAAVAPGSDGLVVLPYFAGERTPLFDPDARGVVAGLTLSHGRGHLYRALLEGTAYGARHNVETMVAAGGRPRRTVAVGGGTRGGLWPQIVSNVTGLTQELPRETIGASYGDAFLAGLGVGLVSPDANWNPPVALIAPEKQSADLYARLYRIYRELYPATRDQVHALAEIQANRVESSH